MEIVKIEPTPSPNTMKVVLSTKREGTSSQTYTEVSDNNPSFINQILNIEGIQSIFHVMDFISIDKKSKADWEELLPQINRIFDHDTETETTATQDNHFGEVHVEVLEFKHIPYQVKLTTPNEESREQLEDRFVEAITKAQKPEDNIIFLRKWEDLGIRYGELEEIFENVRDEINALYPDERLEALIQQAQETHVEVPQKSYQHVTLATYKDTDNWKERLSMLKQFPTPTEEDYPLLEYALNEEKVPIRREAVVLLGMIENKETLPYLYKGLHDKSPGVRRTAGDCLSDLGYKEALPEMAKALDDPQKIVRWRAAMFIFDEGGPEELEALKQHQNDSAYEVKLQIQMAIERIENGEEALGSVWKQIANRNQS
ncbi:virulence factor [Staphylococcus sp. 11261D007BR]